jgi:hypothetical protein
MSEPGPTPLPPLAEAIFQRAAIARTAALKTNSRALEARLTLYVALEETRRQWMLAEEIRSHRQLRLTP